MFGNNNTDGKPVNLIFVESTFIDGRPVPQGSIINNVPCELAMDLAAAGKARIATQDDVDAAAAGKKA